MKYIPFLILLIGCNAQNRCEKKLTKLEATCPDLFKTHDTTIYKTHDSIVYFHDTFTSPAETHTDTFNIPCPDTKPITKHFKGGSATVSVNKGQVIVQCHEDSLKQIINHKDSIILSQKTTIETGLAKTMVTAPPTKWQGFCEYFTWIILIGLALYFGGKALLPILKSKIP